MLANGSLTGLQLTLRRNVIEHLRLLSSVEEQLQYQQEVPLINVVVELICGWFDDDYLPESKAFSQAFSAQELAAMSEFNKAFDCILSTALHKEPPRIEDFIKTSEWAHLSQAASVALQAFENERG